MEYKVLDNPANNAIDFKAFSTSDNANGAPHTVAIMPSKSAEKYFLDFESLSEGLKVRSLATCVRTGVLKVLIGENLLLIKINIFLFIFK